MRLDGLQQDVDGVETNGIEWRKIPSLCSETPLPALQLCANYKDTLSQRDESSNGTVGG